MENPQQKNTDVVEIARKQRHLFLLQKVKQNRQLSAGELDELAKYEAKRKVEEKPAAAAKRPKDFKLSVRRKKFCEIYAKQKKPSPATAYQKAGYKIKNRTTASVAASRLLKIVQIQEYIAYLRKPAVKEAMLTAKGIIKNISRISKKAEAASKFSSALRGEELKGRFLGIFTDNVRVIHKGVDLSELSDEELQKEREKYHKINS